MPDAMPDADTSPDRSMHPDGSGGQAGRVRWIAALLIVLAVMLLVVRMGPDSAGGSSGASSAPDASVDPLAGHESMAWEAAKELVRSRSPGARLPGWDWSAHVQYTGDGRYRCTLPDETRGGSFTVVMKLTRAAPRDVKAWSVAGFRSP